MKTGTSGLMSKLLFKFRVKNVKENINKGSILEIGCGGWPLVSEIKEASEYFGVDIEQATIDKVRNVYHLAKFEVVDAEQKLNFFGNEKFDNIVLLAVVEHLKEPKRLIINISKRLKVNGKIIITTPRPGFEKVISLGSRLGLLDKSAEEEHDHLLGKNDFIEIGIYSRLTLKTYKTFLFGLNQIIVFQKQV